MDLEDPLGAELYPHDQRVRRGRVLFYVRAVKRQEMFVGNGPGGGGFLELVVGLLVAVAWDRAAVEPSTSWKVGVVRYDLSTFGRLRVAGKERLPRGTDPAAAVSGLVRDIECGELDGAVPRWWRPTTYRSSARAAQSG